MTALLPTDRLHLLLAVGSALSTSTTGTTGIVTAVVVLLVLLARVGARRTLAGWSGSVGGGVLAATQRPQGLHPSGGVGQAAAHP